MQISVTVRKPMGLKRSKHIIVVCLLMVIGPLSAIASVDTFQSNWYTLSEQRADSSEQVVASLDKSLWQELSAELDFTEDSIVNKKPQERSIKKLPENNWLKYIWLILIIGILVVVVILIYPYLRRQWPSDASAPLFDMHPETEESLLMSDFQKLLESALKLQDYKLACRCLYLGVLQNMIQQNLIVYRKDKTNMDYLQEIAGTPVEASFRAMTISFESVWYGGVAADQQKYEEMAELSEAVKEAVLRL